MPVDEFGLLAVDHEIGVVVEFPREGHHVDLALRLAAKGVKRVKVSVCGVLTNLSPFQATPLLLAVETDVRLLVKTGVARVFPRPHVFDDDGEILVNGARVSELDVWRVVWPSLEPGAGDDDCCTKPHG